MTPTLSQGFSGGSAGKESACNAGDAGSIPGSGRSAGEGIGYPLQSSWASLVAQLVKNSPAVWETWVRSLGWEDLLEKGTATHSSILECCISFRHMGFPGGTVVKNPTPSAGDARDFGSIPRSGRSPGEGNGNPLQYSCLENSMDRGAWWATVHGVTKSWT